MSELRLTVTNNEVIQRRNLALKSNPKDQRNGGSLLQALDWWSSVLATTIATTLSVTMLWYYIFVKTLKLFKAILFLEIVLPALAVAYFG